jgi:choline kinase
MGNRLRPHTDHVPKALVPLGDGTTPLHRTLGNFRDVGITSTVVVVGYLAEVVAAARPELERIYGVRLDLVVNDKALVWNNAYSLLCALPAVEGSDALLVNGDTVHPASFEQALLDGPRADLTLVVDDRPGMAEEEMKVLVSEGRVTTINKGIHPPAAFGEYVGVSLLPASGHEALISALESTVEKDTNLYYEDGFQEYADRGAPVRLVTTGGAAWTEIDDVADLERAKSIACRS